MKTKKERKPKINVAELTEKESSISIQRGAKTVDDDCAWTAS